MRRKVAFRQKKQNKFALGLVIFVLFSMFVVVSVKCYSLQQKQMALSKQQAQLQEQIEEQTQRTKDLQEFKKYTKTKKYAEEVAKDKLGLVYRDEIIFKPEE